MTKSLPPLLTKLSIRLLLSRLRSSPLTRWWHPLNTLLNWSIDRWRRQDLSRCRLWLSLRDGWLTAWSMNQDLFFRWPGDLIWNIISLNSNFTDCLCSNRTHLFWYHSWLSVNWFLKILLPLVVRPLWWFSLISVFDWLIPPLTTWKHFPLSVTHFSEI